MEAEIKICPDCAEGVKPAASVCRYCGFRFDGVAVQASSAMVVPADGTSAHDDSIPSWVKPTVIASIVLVVLFLFGINAYVMNNASRGGNVDNEKQAKLYFTNQLSDPASAQFKNIYSNERCVTGSMNAKNMMGGYVGFQDFFYNVTEGSGRLKPNESWGTASDPAETKRILAANKQYDYEQRACISGKEDAVKFDAEIRKELKAKGVDY